MTSLDFSQTDVLFLLIGSNPLPNYVSTLLLARPHATVYLLHTGGTTSTLDIAEGLRVQLLSQRPDLNLILEEIDRVDGRQIETRVKMLASKLSTTVRVGLNYTGGTKPMAVHTYRALQEDFPRGIFSYLDAETLSLVVQCAGMPVQRLFVGQTLGVTLKTLFALHGYEILRERNVIFPPGLQDAVLHVHQNKCGFEQWRKWLDTFGQPTPPALPDAESYPALTPVIHQFDALCNGAASPGTVAHQLACKNDQLRSCAKALIGDWFEDYVWTALDDVANRLNLDQRALSMEFKRPGADPMEIDILAIHGYQLFAITCAATNLKERAKEHFLEMLVRARQLGGDEARFGLVCLYKDADRLKRELAEERDIAGKIMVFGSGHLANLAGHLEQWVRIASHI